MNLSALITFAASVLVVLSEESSTQSLHFKNTPFDCLDDTTFRHRNNDKRSCTFYGKRETRRRKQCKKSVIKNACPKTCGNCPRKRPNILLILADDVGTGDIPFYWNTSLVDMPNIQRLANMGVTFTNTHSTPLCAPSRYSLLSGNYPHRGTLKRGSWGINAKSKYAHETKTDSQFLPNQKSIAAVLRDSGGYNTYMSGKYHLGGRVPLKEGATFNETHVLSAKDHDWSKPIIGGPQDLGFGDSLITPSGIQASPYSFFQDGYLIMDANDAVYWREGSYDMPMGTSVITRKSKEGEGSPDWDSSAYNQILVNDTARFIDSHLQGDKSDDPMFMYVALGAVHAPHSPPNQYMNDEPVAGVNPNGHMDMLMEMDLVVGSLVSMIEEKGLADDTIIIFTSDNGGLGGRTGVNSKIFHHFPSGVLRGNKKDIYEGGHRVPMVIRHDGTYPPNEKRGKLVGLNDVYATLCEIAGVDVPDGSAQDSISFAPYITSADNVEGLRIGQSTWTDGKEGNAQDESWQNNKWKVIRHLYQHDDGSFSSNVEFYNLKNDISEAYDLSNDDDDDRYTWKMKTMLDNVRLDGPCPKDVKGQFKLTEGPEKGKEKNCHWFESDRKRCEKYPSDGETFCSSVCGRFLKYCHETGYYWLDKHGDGWEH